MPESPTTVAGLPHPGAGSGRALPAVLVALAASLAVVAVGLVRSDLLSDVRWTRETGMQGTLALGIPFVASVVVSLVARWARLGTGAAQAALGLFLLVAILGPATVLLVIAFLVSAHLLGTSAERDLGALTPAPMVLRTVLGIALVALLVTAMSPFRINFVATHVLPMVAAALLLMRAGVRATVAADLRAARASLGGVLSPGFAGTVGIAALLAALTLMALHVALPERFYDALGVHLYIPSTMTASGWWDYDASSYVFAYWPAAMDFLFAHLHILGGEAGARALNFGLFLLILGVVATAMAAFASRGVVLAVVLLLASLPLAFIETASLFVENGLTLFVTAAVVALALASPRIEVARAAVILVLLAAASNTKLHGAVAAVAIGLTLLSVFLRHRRTPREMGFVSLAVVAAAAVALAPYVASYVRLGTPILPYLNGFFRSPFYDPINFADERWTGRFGWRLPYDMTFRSGSFLEGYTGSLGVAFLALLPAGVVAVVVRRERTGWLALLFALAIALPIVMNIQYLRYLYPVMPLLLIVCGIGLATLFDRAATRAMAIGLMACLVAVNLYKVPSAAWILGAFDFRAAFSPAAARALERDYVPERIANRLINASAGSRARVLYSASPFGGGLEGKALYATWWSRSFREASAGEVSDAAMEGFLRRLGATHVVFDTRPGMSPYVGFHAQLGLTAGRMGAELARIGPLIVYAIPVR